MNKGSHEIEIKLAVEDAASARRLLRNAGFRVTRPRVFECNTLFDTAKLTLRRSSRLLRIRTAGRVATVTFKGKPLIGKHKIREEIETTISDPAALAAIVNRLGLHPVFRYEKYRAEFRQPRRAGIAVVDETPIGVYLELEGTAAWIDRTARLLGFAETDYITASYGRLYQVWCARQGCRPGNMVFS